MKENKDAIKELVTPERVIDVLQMVKDGENNSSIVLGIDDYHKIEDFMVVQKNIESELQAEMVFSSSCSKTNVLDLLDITVSDFKELLQLANINPNELIGDADDFAATLEDMAIDKGAIFSDDAGRMITVAKLEDKRKLSDFLKGDSDSGIFITFNGTKLKSKIAGNSYSLKELRDLIDSKHINAVF
ncbi:MAG: hypothetical protein J6N72_05410 [Psychrobacter sp.]|nr:hypothetical protein [Psychrobacter sp.]